MEANYNYDGGGSHHFKTRHIKKHWSKIEVKILSIFPVQEDRSSHKFSKYTGKDIFNLI